MHPSFKSAGKMKAVKSVPSRLERVKELLQKGSKATDISGFKLPKAKVVRVKISKRSAREEKKAEEEQKE